MNEQTPSAADIAYFDFLRHIRSRGRRKGDRTGTGTISTFGYQMRFDLQQGFPLLTTKKVHWKSLAHELLWFLKGETNLAYLKEHGVKIWDQWATDDGELGPIYGKQWRSWSYGGRQRECLSCAGHGKAEGGARCQDCGGQGYLEPVIDQIAEVIALLKSNPDSRRIIVSAWNPAALPDESINPQANVEKGRMALAACHTLFHFYSVEATLEERYIWLGQNGTTFSDETRIFASIEDHHRELDAMGAPRRILSCQLYARSQDAFIGTPFNIASYALLTHMMAQVTGHIAGEYIHTVGDAHIYLNHQEQVEEQLSRTPRPAPRLWLDPNIEHLDDFTFEHLAIQGYDPHPAIKAPVAK